MLMNRPSHSFGSFTICYSLDTPLFLLRPTAVDHSTSVCFFSWILEIELLHASVSHFTKFQYTRRHCSGSRSTLNTSQWQWKFNNRLFENFLPFSLLHLPMKDLHYRQSVSTSHAHLLPRHKPQASIFQEDPVQILVYSYLV
jgi:hypothetical protein